MKKQKSILVFLIALILMNGIVPVALAETSHTHSEGEMAVSDINELKELFANGGSGYLTADIEADAILAVTNNVNLCLNDRILNLKGKKIQVCAGATFTLDDCGKTVRYYDKNNDTALWTLKAEGTSDFFTIGGVITGGSADNGGGVYNQGTFIMENGNITGNKAIYGGGVGNYFNSSFTMNGGTVSGNVAENAGVGGGVCIFPNSSFMMNAGTISGNTSEDSGGVYNQGTFTMKSGSIIGNTAIYGGGILNCGDMFLTAETGKSIEIIGNTAKESQGGITDKSGYAESKVCLSGKIIIKDNTCEMTDFPHNFATDNAIVISGPLDGSEIYITHMNIYTDNHDAGVLTNGYTAQNPDAGLNDFFHYDGPYYAKLNGNNEIEVVKENVYQVREEKSISNGKVKAGFERVKADETVTSSVNTGISESNTDLPFMLGLIALAIAGLGVVLVRRRQK